MIPSIEKVVTLNNYDVKEVVLCHEKAANHPARRAG
jgi:hypothetical protein